MRHPTPEHAAPARGRSSWKETFSALSYRNFRLLWFGTVCMSAGTWIQQITLGWLAFDLTNSPLQVSIVLGLRAIPMLAAPAAGVIADMFDRRKALLVDQTYLALLALGFALLLIFDLEQLWHLHLFSFLSGAGWGMMNPLRQTLVANSVPRERLMNAIALNSMAFNSMRMVGPGVAGVMITYFGPDVNFVLQAIVYGAVVFLVLPYKAEFAERREDRKRQSPLADLREGLAYVLRQPIPRSAILMTFIPTVTLMAFIQTQLPAFVAVDLGDPDGGLLGLMGVGMGVGGFIGAVFIARFHAIKRKGRLSIVAVAGGALALITLSQAQLWWAAWLVLVVQQMFFIMVMTTNNSILQGVTPDHMRGRVMGIYMLDIGFQPLGGVVAGFLASYHGVSFAWLCGGAAGLAGVIAVALFAPSFRRLAL